MKVFTGPASEAVHFLSSGPLVGLVGLDPALYDNPGDFIIDVVSLDDDDDDDHDHAHDHDGNHNQDQDQDASSCAADTHSPPPSPSPSPSPAPSPSPGTGREDGVLGDVSVLSNASVLSTDLSVDVSVEGLEDCFMDNASLASPLPHTSPLSNGRGSQRSEDHEEGQQAGEGGGSMQGQGGAHTSKATKASKASKAWKLRAIAAK